MEPVIQGWAARLAHEDVSALAALRLAAGVEAAWTDDGWWVRGPLAEGAEPPPWHGLPARERHEWLADDRLRASGARVPGGRLPAGAAWRRLAELVAVELPAVSRAGFVERKAALRLERSLGEAAPGALSLDLAVWTEWASQAAAVRLQPLRFAVCRGDGFDGSAPAKVLVLGVPLPPLPGVQWVNHANVLVPAGWAWQPAVHVSVVRQVLGLRADEVVLWPGEGAPVSIVPAEALVPASRSAARLTWEKLAVGVPDYLP